MINGSEGAIAAGVYDLGLETLRAESFRVTEARVIYTHPGSGAETQLLTIAEKAAQHADRAGGCAGLAR